MPFLFSFLIFCFFRVPKSPFVFQLTCSTIYHPKKYKVNRAYLYRGIFLNILYRGNWWWAMTLFATETIFNPWALLYQYHSCCRNAESMAHLPRQRYESRFVDLVPTLEGSKDAAQKARLPPTTKQSPRIAGGRTQPLSPEFTLATAITRKSCPQVCQL